MTVADIINKHVQDLPAHLQQEALHYVQYLHEKIHAPANDAETKEADQRREPTDKQKEIHRIMTEMAERGTAFAGVDVMAWQKEVRQDRPLPFRDE